MASVLVYTELAGDAPAAAALQVLGEGRRIATTLGATLYALVADSCAPGAATDDLVVALGRHGADKVMLAGGSAASAGPPLWLTHGAALAAACDVAQPLLVLVAATAAGRDIAPRLAAHLGAAFVAEPSIECGPRGEMVLSRAVYGAAWRRRLSAYDLGRTVVATLTPGSYATAGGADDADVIVVEPAASARRVEPLGFAADPAVGLATARVVVTAGAGVDETTWPMVEELAAALGGVVAVTRAARARGLGDAAREVGVGARHVAPRLYVACGASGSQDHMGAVSSDAEIVAIDQDADAPIFRVASYGLVGKLDELLPALIAAVRAGPPGQAPS